jgi:hypothetical protein
VIGRRRVRVTDQFFDRLDALLPQERSADGMPSAADFLLHEMPKIIDALAADYLAATLPIDDVADVRMLITNGLMVAFIVVYVMVASDGGIEILSLDLER